MDLMSGKLSEMRKQGVNKYLVINVLAKRSRALNDGARGELPLKADNPLEYLRVAMAEMDGEKLRVEPKERAGQMVDIAGIVK